MSNKRVLSICSLLCTVLLLHAQAPSGYYAAASGKSGKSLKTALFSIISDHTVRSYGDLWTDFRSTDARPDGKVWDMYSSTTNYTFGDDQAGTYKREGDVYNREHSMPKSWFNDASPMYTDLFHLIPTDGYVNGMRSNLPYGETDSPTYSSNEGFSKVGPCSVAGYGGKVFEPADEYKGDLARNYFYMATAYEDRIATWSSDMLDGSSYPAYAQWAVTMLLRWAKEDPVSQKEIDRNNAVYGIQHNRNPYIDFPGLEQYVWGDKTSVSFDPDDYEGGGGGTTDPDPEPEEVAAPEFSPAPGIVEAGTEVTITTGTEGACIYYTVNDGALQALYPPVRLTIEADTYLSAYAMLGETKSETVTASYLVRTQEEGSRVYVLARSEADLPSGSRLLIVCENYQTALGAKKNDIRAAADVTVADQRVTSPTGEEGLPYELTLTKDGTDYLLFDAVSNDYLALNSAGNKLHSSTDTGTDEARWTISVGDEATVVSNKAYPKYSIQYNSNAPRFACYSSSQRPVSLYVERLTTDGINAPLAAEGRVDVHTLDGRLLRRQVPVGESLRGLPGGFYVVGGRKVLVR